MNILKNKKGFNDMVIIATAMSIFILIGVFLPYINAEFGGTQTSANIEGLVSNIGDEVKDTDSISAFSVLLSVLKMFFWTFGDLPFWLDLGFFVPLRLIFMLTIARNIWVGGGG